MTQRGLERMVKLGSGKGGLWPVALIVLLLGLMVRVGGAQQKPQVLTIAAQQIVPKGQTVSLSFKLPQSPAAGQQVRLKLRARVEYPSNCANNAALSMTVNGRDIVGGDLLNKPLDYSDKNGRDVFWALAKGTVWYLYSWPDFSLERAWAYDSPYAVPPGTDPFTLVLDITSRVRAGTNTLTFFHNEIISDFAHFVEMRDLGVEIGPPIASQSGLVPRPAPTGPLPTYLPRGRRAVVMKAQLGTGGAIRFVLKGHTYNFATRSSLPARGAQSSGSWQESRAGQWQNLQRGQAATARWRCGDYRVTRTVTRHDDHLQVADTFTNTSPHLIGVMVENSLRLPTQPLEERLAGAPPYGEYLSDGGGCNPTALARWKDAAIGLVADGDIFRSHAREFVRPQAIGLADHELGLAAGASHTLEWGIYPVPNGDYWDFINAVRRNWGANFSIPASNVFVDWSSQPRDAAYYRRWLSERGLTTITSYDAMFDEGSAAMGAAIPLAKQFGLNTAAWIKQVHAVAPRVRALVYMNASMCTEPGAARKYPDSRALDNNGVQQTLPAGSPNGITMAPLFVCTPQSSYGKAMMNVVKYIIDDLGADGIYHDVFNLGGNYGARVYGTAWDGCTVSIDPKTHAVLGQPASAVLLQQPWEVALAHYLRGRGKLFFANGPVETRTLLALKIPTFVETMISYSELNRTHLGSPWGFANHPVPDPTRDNEYAYAYSLRRMLDYGGLLALPSWNSEVRTKSFLHLLYPFTPIELHAGMLFGQERILTNRSGLYGWPDNSAATVSIFNASGHRVAHPLVKTILRGKHRLYEIRMPGDHFAILSRQPLPPHKTGRTSK